MKFVSDRAYDVARVACPRLAEIKCYEQVCSIPNTLSIFTSLIIQITIVGLPVTCEFSKIPEKVWFTCTNI